MPTILSYLHPHTLQLCILGEQEDIYFSHMVRVGSHKWRLGDRYVMRTSC
jgi:hypothetical protein